MTTDSKKTKICKGFRDPKKAKAFFDSLDITGVIWAKTYSRFDHGMHVYTKGDLSHNVTFNGTIEEK